VCHPKELLADSIATTAQSAKSPMHFPSSPEEQHTCNGIRFINVNMFKTHTLKRNLTLSEGFAPANQGLNRDCCKDLE
jgi:hypothetical protein